MYGYKILFFILFCKLINAQGLNYIYKPNPNISAVNIKYNQKNENFDVIVNDKIKNPFEQVLTITDKYNNMLGYTNGKFVWAANGDTITNGDSLGWTKSWEMITTKISRFKSQTSKTAIVLPTSSDSLWLLFYQDFVWKYDVDNFHLPYMEEAGEVEFIYTADHLYLSKVRLNKDGKLYIAPEEKDIPVVKDFLIYWSLMAVQHANGSDFWILAPCQNTSEAYSILVSDSIVSVKGKYQFTDTNTKHLWFDYGSIRFSFTGDKIVKLNYKYQSPEYLPNNSYMQYIELFNFDRCEGKVIDRITIDSFPRPKEYGANMDAIFSKNDQYLYISENYSLVRKDLTRPGKFLNNLDTIVKFDRNPTSFLQLDTTDQCTALNYFPDGRIWMNGLWDQSFFSTINDPDAPNIGDVGYTSKAIILPNDPKNPEKKLLANFSHTWYLSPRPSFECSINDKVDDSSSIPKLIVYPNPTSDYISIKGLPNTNSIRIINLYSGQEIFNGILHNNSLDVSMYVSGVYAIITHNSIIKFIKL